MEKEIIDSINGAQKVLVGIGECFDDASDVSKGVYDRLATLMADKDYYVVSVSTDEKIRNSTLKQDRVVAPFIVPEDDAAANDAAEAAWKMYNTWLSCTLNKELCILELGVGLKYPTVVRWPFEKVAMLNNKAKMFRVHESLYQSTEEIKEKCVCIKRNPIDLLSDL